MNVKIPWIGLFYGPLVTMMFLSGFAHITKDIWLPWLRGESLIAGIESPQIITPNPGGGEMTRRETTTLVIFKTVAVPGNPAGYVTTGIRFRSDNLSKPHYQYCYFSLLAGGIERSVQLAVKKGNRSIRYKPLSSSQARSVSRTVPQLGAMAKHKCRFIKSSGTGMSRKKPGIAA